jgi:hypothetical protein
VPSLFPLNYLVLVADDHSIAMFAGIFLGHGPSNETHGVLAGKASVPYLPFQASLSSEWCNGLFILVYERCFHFVAVQLSSQMLDDEADEPGFLLAANEERAVFDRHKNDIDVERRQAHRCIKCSDAPSKLLLIRLGKDTGWMIDAMQRHLAAVTSDFEVRENRVAVRAQNIFFRC